MGLGGHYSLQQVAAVCCTCSVLVIASGWDFHLGNALSVCSAGRVTVLLFLVPAGMLTSGDCSTRNLSVEGEGAQHCAGSRSSAERCDSWQMCGQRSRPSERARRKRDGGGQGHGSSLGLVPVEVPRTVLFVPEVQVKRRSPKDLSAFNFLQPLLFRATLC